MTQQPLKVLYFARSLRELQEKASLQNLDNSSVKLNKSFFENLIPKHSVAAALIRLESLTESLERRYCLQKEEESTRAKFMERIENGRKHTHDEIQGCQYDKNELETTYIEIGVDALSEQERRSKKLENMSTNKKVEEKSFEKELEDMKAELTKQKMEYERTLREPKRISQDSSGVVTHHVTSKKQEDAKQRDSETDNQPFLSCHPKIYLARNRKFSLDFSPIFNIQSSSSSSNLVRRTDVEVNIRPAEASEKSTKFSETLKQIVGEELRQLSISFQIKSFNKETKLLSMSIRFDGPFVTALLKRFEESWKLTFRMKLYGTQEDLYCQDTAMRVLKNERGENAWFGIDVGLIVLEEWLGVSSPLKAKVTIQLSRMENMINTRYYVLPVLHCMNYYANTLARQQSLILTSPHTTQKSFSDVSFPDEVYKCSKPQSTSIPVKNLYFAHSLGELMKKAGVKNRKEEAEITIIEWMWRAQKLGTTGAKHFLEGDEELAFYNLYGYVDTITQLRKTDEYKRHEAFYGKFVSKVILKSAVEQLETISKSLEKRYFLLQLVESEAEEEVWEDALTDFVEESSTTDFLSLSQDTPAAVPELMKLYVVKNQKVSLPLPRMLLTTLFSSLTSSRSPTLFLEKISLNVDIRPSSDISNETAQFCESTNRKLQKEGYSTLFLTFQVTSFQEETGLASISIHAGGPFIKRLLKESKEKMKMTINMKLICVSKWDLKFPDTEMKLFKNERGESTGYGIDVGMIVLEEWLNVHAPPIKGRVTLKVMGDGKRMINVFDSN
ncbi:Ubiquitin carboxyl-terminal hydrolase 8 [Orchesella cincta]|uniref:Ubiquitin carboxyl-terminal hydrolase 8 n=1 Tax=Orchesella cincta TaxID=48709 RepID=A0A1D2M6E8_ORCCI|nr:Ubiquitin carboxyl-terminal hydrolase 8 [Orchesella cincta]